MDFITCSCCCVYKTLWQEIKSVSTQTGPNKSRRLTVSVCYTNSGFIRLYHNNWTWEADRQVKPVQPRFLVIKNIFLFIFDLERAADFAQTTRCNALHLVSLSEIALPSAAARLLSKATLLFRAKFLSFYCFLGCNRTQSQSFQRARRSGAWPKAAGGGGGGKNQWHLTYCIFANKSLHDVSCFALI